MMNEAIQTAKRLIDAAQTIVITAGAGMGVDSGLPDFRGNEGFWRAYPPIKKLGLSFSQMANPQWFEKDPHLAWGFYGHRLELYRKTVPHSGFSLLLELVKTKDENYFIFTSNVDGQFQKAGFHTEKIYEVHGSIHHLQCTTPCSDAIWENDQRVEVDMQTLKAKELLYCQNCAEVARPNILMFGDWSFVDKRAQKQAARLQAFLEQNNGTKTVVLEIGAGEAVPTVRYFGEELARNDNVTLIRINPRDFYVPKGNIAIELGAKEALELLL